MLDPRAKVTGSMLIFDDPLRSTQKIRVNPDCSRPQFAALRMSLGETDRRRCPLRTRSKIGIRNGERSIRSDAILYVRSVSISNWFSGIRPHARCRLRRLARPKRKIRNRCKTW